MKQLLSIKIALLMIFSIVSTSELLGQSLNSVRINEIQVINNDGLKDDFGRNVSWIELYNEGYGKVDVGGCIFKVNGQEYRIPRNPQTVLPSRSYMIFYAGGDNNKGTFYTNFKLDNTNFIEIYGPEMQLLDRLDFNPADMKADVSFGWSKAQDGTEVLMNLPAITLGASNNTVEMKSRGEIFREADPTGIVITITAVAVVAVNLTVLYFIFLYLGRFQVRLTQKRQKKASAPENNAAPAGIKVNVKPGVMTDGELAAIAIAIYQYSQDLHDIEETVLTINRAAKVYSPWSSKIYGLRQPLNKK